MVNVSGSAPITRFDASKFKTQFACEVKDFDPSNYFDRKEARKYDLYTMFAFISAAEAVKIQVSILKQSIKTVLV